MEAEISAYGFRSDALGSGLVRAARWERFPVAIHREPCYFAFVMISVREAIDAAFRHFNELYADQALKDVLLEEVEVTSNGRDWAITIGYRSPAVTTIGSNSPFVNQSPELVRYPREFKRFVIRGGDGSLKEMKIREP